MRRDAEAGKAEKTDPEKSSVFSRQPFLLRAKRMSGFAVQIKRLQRLPHAFSVLISPQWE